LARKFFSIVPKNLPVKKFLLPAAALLFTASACNLHVSTDGADGNDANDSLENEMQQVGGKLLDSAGSKLERVGEKLETGAERAGEKLERAGDRIDERVDGDGRRDTAVLR